MFCSLSHIPSLYVSKEEIEEHYQRKKISHGEKYAKISKELTELIGRWWTADIGLGWFYDVFLRYECNWQNNRFPPPAQGNLLKKLCWMCLVDFEKHWTKNEATRMIKKFLKKVKKSISESIPGDRVSRFINNFNAEKEDYLKNKK